MTVKVEQISLAGHVRTHGMMDLGGPTRIEHASETYRKLHFLPSIASDEGKVKRQCPGCLDKVAKSAPFYPWCSLRCREKATNPRLKMTGRLEDEAWQAWKTGSQV